MASLTPKFCRAHYVNESMTSTQALVWFMKLIYEFWGFCYQTPDSFTNPGGFPTGGVDMPAGFESGSLLMTGSSGYTNIGESIFSDLNADFTSGSIKGKYIVTWKSGSTSNDDGVYLIKKVFGSSSILLDTNMGATPYTGSLIPLFTTRTDINYRVVDFASTATSISMTSGSGLVLELSGASLVNSLQLDPQVRIKFSENAGDNIHVTFSPSGSWNGIDFGDDEFSGVDRAWSSSGTGNGHISLICADDFIIAHWKGQWNTAGSGFHIEIPKRLYSQEYDPNPIIVANWGVDALGTSDSKTNYGGNAFRMHTPPVDSVDVWRPLAITYQGNSYDGIVHAETRSSGLNPGRYNNIAYNPVTDKFYVSDVVLAMLDNFNIWSMGRVRMRRWRLTTDLTPDFSRLGENGEWIKLNDGVMWPWDNAILPQPLLPDGQ